MCIDSSINDVEVVENGKTPQNEEHVEFKEKKKQEEPYEGPHQGGWKLI